MIGRGHCDAAYDLGEFYASMYLFFPLCGYLLINVRSMFEIYML